MTGKGLSHNKASEHDLGLLCLQLSTRASACYLMLRRFM